MIVDLKQNTPEWHELRKNKIGASDAVIIMGDSPWSSPYKLWQQKLGLIERDVINHAMQRGIDLESRALEEFNKLHSCDCVPKVFVSDSYSYLMASLDGYDSEKKTGVEIKCPGKRDHDLALMGLVPSKYTAQLQQQMFVAELDSINYFSYDGHENVCINVKKDEHYLTNLLAELGKFWYCLQNLESPELCERDFLERNDEEWNQLSTEWVTASIKLKEIEKKEKELRDKLIDLSGRSNVMGSGIRLSKIMKKGSIQYDQVPELSGISLEKYRKEPIESFRITKMKE